MSTGAFTNYAAVQDYLFSLKARGVKFGVDRMNSWTAALGNPHRAIPMIHVAGTNGKGSTAAMLAAIFREAGWRTGLYTSPHLVRLGERVQVDGAPLSESEILSYTEELRPVAEAVSRASPDDHPSFFEFMTAMAFLQFQRKRCDIGIVEVGLGGRLDATNVVEPEIAAITSIGLDHCEMLGETVEKIAAEKAGIVKHGRPVVIGRLPAAAEAVVRAIATDRAAPVISVRDVFRDNINAYPTTNLAGEYQRWNAATATLVAREMPAKWRLTDDAIARGLQRVNWPGRWQQVTLGGGVLVLDSSHNPEGAEVLARNLEEFVRATGHRPIVIVGVLGAARAGPLLAAICRHARELCLVVPQQSRACGFEELEALVPTNFAGPVRRSSVGELFPQRGQCAVGGRDRPVVVTGSIYLLGEVLARLEPERGAGEGRLQDF